MAKRYSFGGGRVGRAVKRLGGTGVAIHGFPTAMTRVQGQAGLSSKKRICLFTAALSGRRGMFVGYDGM